VGGGGETEAGVEPRVREGDSILRFAVLWLIVAGPLTQLVQPPSAWAAAVIATIPVGMNPDGLRVDPTTHKVYVTNLNSGTVSLIDGATNPVIATIPVGAAPASARGAR
jgi:YVTN family beta-propeller protein